MSRKQPSGQYNKFYHNDIKKQLGIDDSRTASEKLLDRAIKVDKRPDFYTSQSQQGNQTLGQPKKKVKQDAQNQKPLSNKEILQNKLFKNIQNQLNVTKLLKSLSILMKCLNQQNFLNDPEINFIQTWESYSQKLISQITERNYCSGQSFNIMANIGDCLQILVKKFDNKGAQQKNEEGQVKDALKQTKVLTTYQVHICFCRLFTDDSFVFNKNLAKLKTFIFSQFDSQNASKTQEPKLLTFNLIQKLVTIPIKFQWAYTSLVNLFKEFNNQGYQNEFSNQTDRKTYLKNFNDLLNRKPKSTGSTSSYNILGSSKESSGLKTVHIQAITQNNNDKWVNNQ